MSKITNQLIIEKAREAGFDLIGFARAEKLTDEVQQLRKWLKKKQNAGMEYMERNLEKREDVSLILPGAKSVISLAVNYFTPYKHSRKNGYGKISRYAWGEDYHLHIWKMLEQLESKLAKIDENFKSKSYVDTGPVIDRVWAVRSGLGWQGKNGNVITKEFGSWVFIATIITNYEFDYGLPMPDACGTCTACIKACPTNAITSSGIVDSNRCISYLTIENKGSIPDKFQNQFDDWLFGCDICQDVCPWNKKFAKPTNKKYFEPKMGTEINLDFFEGLSNREFNKIFYDSPIKRARAKGMRRNADFLKKDKNKNETNC